MSLKPMQTNGIWINQNMSERVAKKKKKIWNWNSLSRNDKNKLNKFRSSKWLNGEEIKDENKKKVRRPEN